MWVLIVTMLYQVFCEECIMIYFIINDKKWKQYMSIQKNGLYLLPLLSTDIAHLIFYGKD